MDQPPLLTHIERMSSIHRQVVHHLLLFNCCVAVIVPKGIMLSLSSKLVKTVPTLRTSAFTHVPLANLATRAEVELYPDYYHWANSQTWGGLVRTDS